MNKNILIFGGVGVGLYLLYQYLKSTCASQSTGLCSVYNSIFQPSTTPPASAGGGGAPPPPSGGTPPPVQPQLPPAPPPAAAAPTVKIIGTVSANVNNSLSADISLNGSPKMNIAIIQDSGRAYDSSGSDVTDKLTALGVDVGALLAQFQAAYIPPKPTVDPVAVQNLKNTLASLQTQYANAASNPAIQQALQAQIQLIQSQLSSLGVSGINDGGFDLAYPYIFGKSSLGAIADDRFAHSRVPAVLIHQGPRLVFRRS